MTEAQSRLSAWIENHLWAILAVGLGAFAGYLTGEAQTTARLEAVEKDIARLEAQANELDKKVAARSDFMVCAVRNIDRLMDKTGTEYACPLKVPE